MGILGVVLCLFAAVISAEKDSNFYPWGENPNVQDSMYWNDAINVLQDLDQFSGLYIKVHRCVWSSYGNGAGVYDNGCGGYEGNGYDGAYWYMGRTQCFRANAAFSLYGVLPTHRKVSSWKSMCNKYTYINSFMTDLGAESISDAFGFGNAYTRSLCTPRYKRQNYNNSNDRRYLEDRNEDDYISATMGCSNGRFVFDKFQGMHCNGHKYLKTTSNLTNYNLQMLDLSCAQIWDNQTADQDNYYYNPYYNNGNDDLFGWESVNNGTLAVDILTKSRVCSIRQYPNDCPDPFRVKKQYTAALENAAKEYGASQVYSNQGNTGLVMGKGAANTLMFFSSVCFAVGAVLGTVAAYRFFQIYRAEQAERESRGNKRRPKNFDRNDLKEYQPPFVRRNPEDESYARPFVRIQTRLSQKGADNEESDGGDSPLPDGIPAVVSTVTSTGDDAPSIAEGTRESTGDESAGDTVDESDAKANTETQETVSSSSVKTIPIQETTGDDTAEGKADPVDNTERANAVLSEMGLFSGRKRTLQNDKKKKPLLGRLFGQKKSDQDDGPPLPDGFIVV